MLNIKEYNKYVYSYKKENYSKWSKKIFGQKNITLHKRIKDKIKDEYNLNIY